MKCPKCGSSNIEIMGKDRKGFSLGKAVVGGLISGGIGTLVGFAGKNGKKYDCFCRECGKEFKRK